MYSALTHTLHSPDQKTLRTKVDTFLLNTLPPIILKDYLQEVQKTSRQPQKKVSFIFDKTISERASNHRPRSQSKKRGENQFYLYRP